MGLASDLFVASMLAMSTYDRDMAALWNDRAHPEVAEGFTRKADRFTAQAHAVWMCARNDAATDPMPPKRRVIADIWESHANALDTLAEIEAEMGNDVGAARVEALAELNREHAQIMREVAS